MATRHRRIGVTLDLELETALTATRLRLRASSDAARIRELALIGANEIETHDADVRALATADRVLDELGATKSAGDLLTASARALAASADAAEPNAHGETPQEALAGVRGHNRGY